MERDLLCIFAIWIEIVLLDQTRFLEDLEVEATDSESECEEELAHFILRAFDFSISNLVGEYFKHFDLLSNRLLKQLILSLT